MNNAIARFRAAHGGDRTVAAAEQATAEVKKPNRANAYKANTIAHLANPNAASGRQLGMAIYYAYEAWYKQQMQVVAEFACKHAAKLKGETPEMAAARLEHLRETVKSGKFDATENAFEIPPELAAVHGAFLEFAGLDTVNLPGTVGKGKGRKKP